MGQPAAKLGDQIVAMDTHIVLVNTPTGPVPTPQTTPFTGQIDNDLSANVLIAGLPAATLGSLASNEPPHIPIGGQFQIEPTNIGQIISGSGTVLINDKPAARAGDIADTCNDPVPAPIGTVIAEGTVLIGG